MGWMAWTRPTAIFFAVILGGIVAMLIWELRSPTISRRGLLPMPTTRGDRFFIGLLTSAFVHMAWIGLTSATPIFATVISLALMLAIGVWG